MPKFKFNYKGKEFSIEVLECKTFFQKARGLMFKKKSKPLLFLFDRKTREGIHSFFCLPFVAIWFLNGKIIEKKYVKPNKFLIRPVKKFDSLLEIPVGNMEFNLFLDESRKV